MLGLCSSNRYEIDLSNEVINFDFGLEAANSANPECMGSNQADKQIFF